MDQLLTSKVHRNFNQTKQIERIVLPNKLMSSWFLPSYMRKAWVALYSSISGAESLKWWVIDAPTLYILNMYFRCFRPFISLLKREHLTKDIIIIIIIIIISFDQLSSNRHWKRVKYWRNGDGWAKDLKYIGICALMVGGCGGQ